ncbi:DUF1697 domain-containing protein [Paenibacillus sp. 32O-W]|uniref:DUF1697 domain-containing protein n=1 Tax=Paenibacillus sp. 32O-W TaxID=1695218 RepID=UPI0011A88BF4|nr:DUF1697 domain-containing protein [Paenibacillus sp. 32O-W]
MPICIALLRGINVSGQKIIKMDQLSAIFESLGFQNVQTYIQSGNVVFQTVEEEASKELVHKIESRLKETLGYEVTVVLRTMEELEEVVERNPYDLPSLTPDEKVYVSFLSGEPAQEAKDRLLSYKNEIDDYRLRTREVYILCRKGYGKSLFSNNFLEKKLGLAATTRNWATVNKLVAMAESLRSKG